MSVKELVPLSEINGVNEGRVTWNLTLPEYAPVDRIGINTEALDHLAIIAGFSRLSIGGHNGIPTTHTPEINGINASGEATSSLKVNVKKAALQDAEITTHTRNPYLAAAIGSISINTPELISSVERDKRQSPLRNPDAWSVPLQKAVSHGIRAAAFENIMKDTDIIGKSLGTLWMGLATNNALNADNLTGVVTSPVSALTAGLVFTAYTKYMVQKRQMDTTVPISLWPGWPLDRYASVQFRTRTTKLVEPIKLGDAS